MSISRYKVHFALSDAGLTCLDTGQSLELGWDGADLHIAITNRDKQKQDIFLPTELVAALVHWLKVEEDNLG